MNENLKLHEEGVHRCGIGGSMRACHAAVPGSIPVWTSFLAEVLSGFFLAYKTNVRRLLGLQGPRISFGRQIHPIILALLE